MNAVSVTQNGRLLKCDGAGCVATARVPVALRSVLGAAGMTGSSVYGWLYVVREGQWSHYCPKCNTAYLSSLAASDCEKQSVL